MVGSLNSYYLGQHFDGAYNKQNKYNNALKPSNVLSKYHFYRTDTNKSIICVFQAKYKPKLDLASINWIFPGSNFLGLCILEIPNWIFPSPVVVCISSVSTCYNNIKLYDLLWQNNWIIPFPIIWLKLLNEMTADIPRNLIPAYD